MTKARVLLADDSVVCRNVFVILLENAGYEVTSVFDGQEALKALRTSPFDLAILDNEMPNLDGIGALTELRQFLPDLPVVVCSGTVTSDHIVQYRALGISDILTKPVDPRTLREKIARVLALRHAPAPTHSASGLPRAADDAPLPSPLIAGPSKIAAKLSSDSLRLRDFRSVAIIEGRHGSGRFELALNAAPVTNSHKVVCHATEVSAAHLDELLKPAHEQHLPPFLVVLEADRLDLPRQALIEQLVRGRLEKHADLSKRLRLVLCAQDSLCDLHFNEYLLMRAMATTYRVPDFSTRQEDWVDIAKAILRRASSGKDSFGPAALKWIDQQPWPGDYMQMHRMIELARRQAKLTSIVSAMHLQLALAAEAECSEPLFHDMLFHVHSGGD